MIREPKHVTTTEPTFLTALAAIPARTASDRLYQSLLAEPSLVASATRDSHTLVLVATTATTAGPMRPFRCGFRRLRTEIAFLTEARQRGGIYSYGARFDCENDSMIGAIEQDS